MSGETCKTEENADGRELIEHSTRGLMSDEVNIVYNMYNLLYEDLSKMSRPEIKFSRSGYVEVTHQNDPRVMRSFARHLVEYLQSRSLNYRRITCQCEKCLRTYAFVYPQDPTHTIHLGDVFFRTADGPRGKDTKVGTLVHELTHF